MVSIEFSAISQRNCSMVLHTFVDCESIEDYTREFSILSSAGLKRSLVLLFRNPPARFSIPALIEARVEYQFFRNDSLVPGQPFSGSYY
ncbi:hypothetical protein EV677_0449 [Herminiimonas fonticola]|uniref:Uncharacterized protein n=1 Tax=Herminiimonas fonticola TaxID=303380 RepID=A0A4R6GHR4_9BURK|nr:hypothetical protein Hfont_0429 [Herminiimonas fonticola]TDN93910.1 hypothetical protein EV677_0449 [Herminiimonas fonticola]